ncbi:MAG: fluoride efflux transporter CrcB [Deltaproteobacteria bacterium]|nr:fluoride efflux transporter CrcB [Deltaproteobacteria bacterium]
MKPFLLVGFGGFLGAVLRYKLGGFVLHHSENWRLPLGTLLVNVVGCLVLGLITGALEKHEVLKPELSLFIITGVLGGFTTFSAFGFETFYLLKRGDFPIALLNILLSVSLCLTAVWIGNKIGK